MEEKRTDYGKIFAVTLSVMAVTSVSAVVCHRLLCNFMDFCAVYDEPVPAAPKPSYDEIEESPAPEAAGAFAQEGDMQAS